MTLKKMVGMFVLSSVMFCCSLTAAGGPVPVCTVTQDPTQTTYRVTGLPPVSGSCGYSWANSSLYVLANDKDKIPWLVKTNSLDILVTSKCIDMLHHERTCFPEGESYNVNCTISCHGDAQFQKDKEIPYVVVPVVVILVILGIIVFIVFLCYKFRDKILRNCGCTMYFAVKKQPDVEAGK